MIIQSTSVIQPRQRSADVHTDNRKAPPSQQKSITTATEKHHHRNRKAPQPQQKSITTATEKHHHRNRKPPQPQQKNITTATEKHHHRKRKAPQPQQKSTTTATEKRHPGECKYNTAIYNAHRFLHPEENGMYWYELDGQA